MQVKKCALWLLTGMLALFFLSSPDSVFAEISEEKQGNYILEYQYELTNPSRETISVLQTEGLVLLPESSPYYTLIRQQIDGTVAEKDGMFLFSKTWDNVEGQTTIRFSHIYELQLDTLKNQVDTEKVQPLADAKNYAEFLKKEKGIDPQHELIRKTAEEVAGSESNPYIKAWRLFEFVATKMKYNLDSPIKNTGAANAIEDIQKAGTDLQQGGTCYDYAALYVSLLRNQGIPARVVSGFKVTPMDISDLDKYKKIDIIYNLHSWVEFYLEPYGWLFADPTIQKGADSEDISKNFAQTDNLYIKKGYNLPFDIFKYSITSKEKTGVNVRQSAILKRNQDAEEENQEPAPQKGVSQSPINIQTVIDARKNLVLKTEEFQKAREELRQNKDKETERLPEEKTKEKEKPQYSKQKEIKETNNHEKGKVSFWKRLLDFIKSLIHKLFKE